MRQFKVVAEQTKESFEEEINKLGEGGWEIIHYGSSVSIGSTRSNKMVLFSAILEKEKTITKKKVNQKYREKKTIEKNKINFK